MVVGGDSDDDQPDSGSPVSRSEDEGPGGGPSGSAKQELGVSRGKGTTPGRYDGYRDDLDWTRSDASVLEGGGEGTGDPTDPFADSDDDGFEVPVSVVSGAALAQPSGGKPVGCRVERCCTILCRTPIVHDLPRVQSVGPATGGPAHRHISSGSTKAPVTHHDDTVPGTSRDDEVADSLGDAGEDTAAEEASTPEGDVSEAPQQRSARSRSSRSRSDMSSGQSSTVFDCTLGQGMLSSVQVPSEEAGATAGGFGEGDGGSGRTGGGGAPGDEMYSAGQRGDEPYNTGREGGKGRRHVVWNDEGEKGQQDEGREVVRGETGRGETLVEGGEEDEAVLGIVGERKGENAGQSEDDVALGAREGDLEDADGLDGEEEADGTGRAFRSQSLSSVILHDEAEEEGSAEAQTIPRLTMINVDDGHGENKNGGSVAAAGGKMGWEERQEEVGGSQGGWRTRVKEDGEVEIEIDADDWDDFAEEDEGDEEMDGWGGDGEGGRGGQGETLGGDVAAEGGAGAALGEGGGGEDGEDEPFAGDGNQDANDEGGLSSPIRGGAIAKRRDDMSEEAGVTNEEGGLSRPIRGGAIANRKEKNEGGKSREEEAMFEGSDSGEDPFGETGNSGEWAFDIPDSGKEPEGAAEGPSDKRGTHGLEQLMLSRPSRMGTVGESMGGDDYGDGDELIGTLKTPRSRAGDSVVDPSRCPTCGSAYNGRSCLPKVLPCGHVQCEWCITDILKVAAGGGAVATCPRPGCSMVLGVAQQSAELTVELMPLSREALEAVGEQSGAGKGGLARDREGMGRDEEDDLDRQFEAGMEALQNLR